ncbi:hypothetical protein J8F10_09715 [Gemmata sp. G18]|uniref:Uncharacterized protein n=1 Tax=Gemmata palustris TaxID=2822762 RepID=A0ABS5BQ31_9BACT|nr:hypothetical protein [Gemmata palustris]MBP3955557.1 hypothetical protein [Gemmata palustris]
MNDETLKRLAELIYSAAQSRLTGSEWHEVIFEVRYNKQGESWITKLRVNLSSGEITSLNTPSEITLLLIDINESRTVLGHQWYGAAVKVGAAGQCEIQLNYDPDCAEDASFFRD